MSAGAFTRANYQASYNTAAIHPIRVQPETLALSVTIGGSTVTNSGSASALTTPTSVRVGGGRRRRGVNARLIRIQFSGTPPTGYKAGSTITLPAINPALLSAPNGATGTYLGAAIVVIGTTPESSR